MRKAAQSPKRDIAYTIPSFLHTYGSRRPKVERLFLPTKKFVSPHALTSRVVRHVTEKGWSSDFPPLPSAFSPKRTMAFMLKSHNGVHCCGTVGDSHPVHYVDLFSPQQNANKFAFAFGLRKRSQLIAAKRTFTGDSFQNHDAKVQSFFERASCFSY